MSPRIVRNTLALSSIGVLLAVACSAQVTKKYKEYEVTVSTVEQTEYWRDPQGGPRPTILTADAEGVVLVLGLQIKSSTGKADLSEPLRLLDAAGRSYESNFLSLSFLGAEGKATTFNRPIGIKVPRAADIKSLAIGETTFDIQGMVKAARPKK